MPLDNSPQDNAPHYSGGTRKIASHDSIADSAVLSIFVPVEFESETMVGRTQLMHFTCFTGSHRRVEMWLKGFPQTYFGFCKRVETFDESQCDALRRMDKSRILLETYSPFIKFGGHKPSTPNQLGMVADTVAKFGAHLAERIS